MQTFLPFPDFRESARVIDMKRLGKQRVETFQIVGGLTRAKLVTEEQIGTRMARRKKILNGVEGWFSVEVPVIRQLPVEEWTIIPRVTNNGRTWGDHVIGQMWLGHEYALLEYQRAVCDIWTERGGKNDTCLPKTTYLLEHMIERTDSNSRLPEWLGREDVHASHRSNLLRKDPNWYSQFGWTEPDNLEYVWPA